jgi:hypothetical protein
LITLAYNPTGTTRIQGIGLDLDRKQPATIAIESESPGDSRTLFRFWNDDNVVAENLTAAQAHILVGKVLERVALPNKTRIRAQQKASGKR